MDLYYHQSWSQQANNRIGDQQPAINHAQNPHQHQDLQQQHHHQHVQPLQPQPHAQQLQQHHHTQMHPPHQPSTLPLPPNQSLQQPSNVVADSSVQDENHDIFIDELVEAILDAKQALEKPIEERDSRDISLIDSLCSLVHGFDNFPKTVRRSLAAQAVLIVIADKDKELIVHNEELDSFCVLIYGQCEQLNPYKTASIRTYQVGDAFGVCEPTSETVRFVGYMVTRCEHCAFLCVKRDEFYTILTDTANYPEKDIIRHRDRLGNVVCVSQLDVDKKTREALWTHHMQPTSRYKLNLPDGHIIIKATEKCLLLSLLNGYERVDADYVEDFLLLFRVFLTQDIREREKKLPPGMIKLCLNLAESLNNLDYRDKVVKIILTWLSSYYQDFELNPEFTYLYFKYIESKLFALGLNNQSHLLNVTLSAKSKLRNVTITKSSREQPLNFTISGGYEKNCGIFVNQVNVMNIINHNRNNINHLQSQQHLNHHHHHHPNNHSTANIIGDVKSCEDTLMNYLNSNTAPTVPPRNKLTDNLLSANDPKISVPLRPGDQILEVNGTNFSAIKLSEAQKKLDMSTHLCLTVKYNPSSFHEMRTLPEGRRKSSLSSLASVTSPFQSASTTNNSQSKFTFNLQDNHIFSNYKSSPNATNDHPPPSPMFTTNSNLGFKSLMNTTKSASRGGNFGLSSLIKQTSKQIVKQIRDSTQTASNIDSQSKASDNLSEDQISADMDWHGKSNLTKHGNNFKFGSIETKLSSVVNADTGSTTEQSNNHANNNGYSNQTPVNVLRVFNAANNDSRYLLVHEETTAREVVMIAVKEFNLTSSSSANNNLPSSVSTSALGSSLENGLAQSSSSSSLQHSSNSNSNDKISSLNWHLYEVSVVPESKTIKQKCLSEQTSRLAERAALCSRFYIKNTSQSSFGPSKLDMGDDFLVNEILKEGPISVTLTSLNATLLAVELTLADFDKFKSIEPQQFVYDTFFNHLSDQTDSKTSSQNNQDKVSLRSSSSLGQADNSSTGSGTGITTASSSRNISDLLHILNKTRSIPKTWIQEYTKFTDVSNREMFWVVCEILNERNLSRRVKIIKQFIRVADVCSNLRNYNSMFAIIQGLGHSSVSRLKRTFDKLKPKYKSQLEKMGKLFDLHKNMANYRLCLQQTPPPAIPLLPQIKKDLTFTKEGRSIFVRESNDHSDAEQDEELDDHPEMINYVPKHHEEPNIHLSQLNGREFADSHNPNGHVRHSFDISHQPHMDAVSTIRNHGMAPNQRHSYNGDMMTQPSAAIERRQRPPPPLPPSNPPQSYTNNNPRADDHQQLIPRQQSIATSTTNQTKSERNNSDVILINFAEIRQFTERVRNVTHYSSIPYSNELLTLASKDGQRNQNQVKKMHEEWQMRKRIRHYLTQTLYSSVNEPEHHDQTDSSNQDNDNQNLRIIDDVKILTERSYDVEPEMHSRSHSMAPPESRRNLDHMNTMINDKLASSSSNNGTSNNNSGPPPLPPQMMQPVASLIVTTNMQPIPVMPSFVSCGQRSPTLSKSSSISSCSSSFNHSLGLGHVGSMHHSQIPLGASGLLNGPESASANYHHNQHNHLIHQHHHHNNHNHNHLHHQHHQSLAPRIGNLTISSNVGKFGTESTESLRKLQSLRENVDMGRSSLSASNSSSCHNIESNNNTMNLDGGNSYGSNSSSQNASSNSVNSKGLVGSRFFVPPRFNR